MMTSVRRKLNSLTQTLLEKSFRVAIPCSMGYITHACEYFIDKKVNRSTTTKYPQGQETIRQLLLHSSTTLHTIEDSEPKMTENDRSTLQKHALTESIIGLLDIADAGAFGLEIPSTENVQPAWKLIGWRFAQSQTESITYFAALSIITQDYNTIY